MPIAHVQDAALSSGGSVTGAQQTGAFASNPTVGNYIVGWAWGWSNTNHPSKVTWADTGVNTYTVPAGAFQDRANDLWCAIAYAKVATSGATFKVSANPQTAGGTNSTGALMVCAAEFSTVAASTPEDGSAVGTTSTTGSPAPGSKSLTSGSLALSVMVNDKSGASNTVTTPAGFTRVGVQVDGNSFEVGEGVYAINPTSPANPTWNTGAVAWGAAQFALLAVATGAVPARAAVMAGQEPHWSQIYEKWSGRRPPGIYPETATLSRRGRRQRRSYDESLRRSPVRLAA